MTGRTAAIIQARMGSTRLPGKTAELLSGKPLIRWVLESAHKIAGVDDVILAVPDSPENRFLQQIAEETGSRFFQGPEDDVLGRFILAAEAYGAETILRICGDNPLFDYRFMGEMTASHVGGSWDYSRTLSPIPLGTVGEVIAFSALTRSAGDVGEARYKMHVTTYVLDHPDRFRINTLKAPDYLAGRPYRMTVDTEMDMQFFRRLAESLSAEGKEFDLFNALAILQTHPELAAINASVPQHDWRSD